jgi:hypothetical protein
MENTISHQADFIFVESGNVYIIEKDRRGMFRYFVAVDGMTAQLCLDSEFKTQIKNVRGEVIMQNFKETDMKVVQELLSGAEESYEKKLKILADIDNALDEGNRELFLALTEELKLLDGGTESEHGVA